MAGDHEDDDDPQLKALRQVWLSMRDEDPPARDLDALMAAARSHADVLAKPTLWQRIVAALRRPPMLALATVMILVGGVVLFTRHGDELEKAPTAPATLPDPAKPGARDMELHSEPMATPPRLAVPADPTTTAQHPAAVQPPRPVSRPHPHNDPTPQTQPQSDDGFAAGQNHDAMPRAQAHGAVSGGEDKLDAKKEAKAPPPNEVLVEQLATQARSAATRGDCETARSIGARIARQDASYYRDHVAGDLSGCAAATTTLDAR